MNKDPSKNVIVFEVMTAGVPRRFGGHALTRDPHCLQKIWASLAPQAGFEAKNVQRLYSEWQLSENDLEFATRTFPTAQLSYSFLRPKEDAWDAAFAEASQIMQRAAVNRAAPTSTSKKWWQIWK